MTAIQIVLICTLIYGVTERFNKKNLKSDKFLGDIIALLSFVLLIVSFIFNFKVAL